ncbi:hypothetical protein CHAB381_0887 [Campylobacter hominis ATCC BAA-381]|uniref:Uncharacterized protein n=1 Tax=Campylobacter hominis (strain ATCC BAA-381 / DSM 21671 / CCUG 45161 / LMG 19568 / NCTC 13146 / CH001A) TaxID=360107 RepID=A7I1Q8_CAMHC|nr:hypothetical protein CHAB381_0887 [Campylobacter hominis ATCC BAA-381]
MILAFCRQLHKSLFSFVKMHVNINLFTYKIFFNVFLNFYFI